MIIVTGTLAYDYIMDFPGSFSDHILPEKLHAINLSFIVNKFERHRGGTAGNVSYALGLLQTPHILFSCAGKDFDPYKKDFKKFGISLAHVAIDKKTYTSTGFAMTDKKDSQIWGFFYGASENITKLQMKSVANKNDLVLIGPSGATGSISLLKQCIKLEIPFMFDPGFILTQVSDADLSLGVEHAKFLIGNDYEIELIKSRVKNWKTFFAKKTVITTLGENGALIYEQDKKYTVAPVTAKKVVDPTGAGDAWRAGFLAGLSQNFSLQTCGQMGSLAACYAVEGYGTQEYTYSRADFTKRYRQSFKTLLEW
jgi:adenosine kinase